MSDLRSVADVIRLLSDHLANQIAAGEVIQRPASAVKELLENSIDAGATEIILVLKDAGKELVQVIDNGSGMTPTDARMAFERHATSKIRDIDDLFRIHTMGFRGEALASIAAVAQIELRTRKEDVPVGTRIVIEGTEVKSQEPDVTAVGTNFQMKNLFFNVPARRHFLKSNSTELRHIIDEFTRVTMAHPQVAFRMTHNGTEQFRLEAGNLKTRIVGLLGQHYEKNLVPVEELAGVVNIRGFVGKPTIATRTRGNQYFFVNNRFIRSPFLHHAVVQAYEGLLEKETVPFYVLFIDVDPKHVDVNVHPTKQEVKFDDERMMYQYLMAATRHALSRYNIAPSLDFSLDAGIQSLPALSLPQTQQDRDEAGSGYLANNFSGSGQAFRLPQSGDLARWQDLYKREGNGDSGSGGTGSSSSGLQFPAAPGRPQPDPLGWNDRPGATNEAPGSDQSNPGSPMNFSGLIPESGLRTSNAARPILNIQGAMLVTTVKSGLLLLHLRRAQERIWYERLTMRMHEGATASQQLLFPITVHTTPAHTALIHEGLAQLRHMGFDIAPMPGEERAFLLQGLPAGLPGGMEHELLQTIAEAMQHAAPQDANAVQDLIARAVARQLSYATPPASAEAQQSLIDELFGCAMPEWAPDGKQVFTIVGRDSLEKMLG